VSVKVTVPSGGTPPPLGVVTVAVNVTLVPRTDGLVGMAARAVAVASKIS
jgi:hypothetical protein